MNDSQETEKRETEEASPVVSENEDTTEAVIENPGVPTSKKKKKKKKPSSSANTNNLTGVPALDNSRFRKLGNWEPITNANQTPALDVPLDDMYKGLEYSPGQQSPYESYTTRYSAEELKQYNRVHESEYQDLRKAAECHRLVRRYIQSIIKPDINLIELTQALEAKTKFLLQSKGLECGWGFPTGCSLNNCAAHYTPNYGDKTCFRQGDIMKLDFGTHINGRIIDCAFTIAFEPHFNELIMATIDGTNTGLKHAGIDARINEISAEIQEAIEAYEVTINNKTYKVKPIQNLTGHSIAPYKIHAGKSVPIVKQSENSGIMEEGELYAIETFASTGKGWVQDDLDCSHFMKNYDAGFTALRLKSAKSLLHTIDQNFGTLAFCRRWLDDIGAQRHLLALSNLVEHDVVRAYPPLSDIKNSYTSQFEHTILLKPTAKEVLSRGDDF